MLPQELDISGATYFTNKRIVILAEWQGLSSKSQFYGAIKMSIEKLDFQKATKQNIPFTMMSTKVLQKIKDRDSLCVWVYLCSLPPEWKINKTQIKNHFSFGEKKIKKVFSYLKQSNLIEYIQEKNTDGSFKGTTINTLCGEDFIETDSVGAISAPTVKKSTKGNTFTAGSISVRTVNGAYRKDIPIKEINNKKENKKSFCDSEKQKPPKKSYDNAKKHSWADKTKPKAPLANVDTQSNSHMKYSINTASLDIREQYMTKIKHSIGMRV